jgi:predicted glycosyltransferase
MRIWIDLANSPHVNFFAAMIEDLRREHEVVLTTRPFANTIDLLELKGFPYHLVGRHYGANRVKKVLGFGARVGQLYQFLKKRDIDVAISHTCCNSPLLARLLGFRSLYLNDNEHAAGNRIGFPLATTIMVPEFFPLEKVRRQGGRREKVVQYPGVKEGVYLSRLRRRASSQAPEHAATGPEIFIRPEPWAAQYYRGAVDFLDEVILDLKRRYPVVVFPRGEHQAVHYRQPKFTGIHIPDRALTLEDIQARCALFIGAGGTMTREAAVLGIPTISVYQDDLLDVDRYLIAQGRMVHVKDLTAAFVEEFLARTRGVPPSEDLLRKGAVAYRLILQTLLNGNASVPAKEEGAVVRSSF